MKTALLVLWLYSASGFSIGPISLGPGWFATKNIFTTDHKIECVMLGAEMASMRASITNFTCEPAGEGPPEKDWAKVIR